MGDVSGRYAHVERRADGDWGVSLRSGNNRGVWHSGEGWTDLSWALTEIREWVPGIRIVIVTDDEAAPTVIEQGAPLP